jgi:hypothetical protein
MNRPREFLPVIKRESKNRIATAHDQDVFARGLAISAPVLVSFFILGESALQLKVATPSNTP